MSHRKGLLPSDTYHVIIRQNYNASDKDKDAGDELVIVWTVDCGEYTWRNLKERFDPDSVHDMFRLQKICDTLNFEMYPTDHEEFYDQWLGLRAMIKVTVDLSKDSVFKRNVILEHKLPQRPPETDVMAGKDNTHFTDNQQGRNLPI